MKRILILSHDMHIGELLLEIVRGEGYDALPMRSVGDAISALHSAPVDLIISNLDGLARDDQSWDRIRQVRQANGHVPIIVCATSPPRDSLATHTFDALVTMPFEIDQLLSLVTQFTNGASAGATSLSH